jgi:uncharacterized membrane protein YqiK
MSSSGFTEAERLALQWKKQQKEQSMSTRNNERRFISRERSREKSLNQYGKNNDEERESDVDEFGRNRRPVSDRYSSKSRYLEERRDLTFSRKRSRSSSRRRDTHRAQSSPSSNRDHSRSDRRQREKVVEKEESSWKHDLFNHKDEERYAHSLSHFPI